ncbi:uncharacterized protein LOC124118957 [Haliotis rufescens]|uniref:uncharacterized protein LOC124118957 n=1 Tax=Haliotis rufescens TaxID=6454 RepID=UPI00201EFE7C|nr:uncharacterized protein LOC124118957 [Haliotis rufescens]XP_048253096.1 uncharacterized protein LOC124118957 [Haliotis rufescens]
MDRSLTADEDLWTFWTSGVREYDRPRLGVAACVLGNRTWKVFYSQKMSSTWCKHAEYFLIKELEERLKNRHFLRMFELGSSFKVTIYQNYSPCGKCAELYCGLVDTFKRHGLNVTLNIYFAALYKICWDINRPHDVGNFLNVSDHNDNVAGLVKLVEKRTNLRSFKINTWLELLDVLDELEPLIYPAEFVKKYARSRLWVLRNYSQRRCSADTKIEQTFHRIVEPTKNIMQEEARQRQRQETSPNPHYVPDGGIHNNRYQALPGHLVEDYQCWPTSYPPHGVQYNGREIPPHGPFFQFHGRDNQQRGPQDHYIGRNIPPHGPFFQFHCRDNQQRGPQDHYTGRDRPPHGPFFQFNGRHNQPQGLQAGFRW